MVAQTNPQWFLLLKSHVQEHVVLMARDQVTKFFQISVQEAQSRGEPVPQIDPAAIEAALL